MKTIMFIPGSIRENSFNQRLIEIISERIGDRAETYVLDYRGLPFMNTDLEKDLPEEVRLAKEAVGGADAIWIVSPEYNGMIPGVLKNALDWLSRPYVPGDFASGTALKGKPVTISGVAGANKAMGGIAQLEALCKRLMMKVMETPAYSFAATQEHFRTDTWEPDEGQLEEIDTQIDSFLQFVDIQESN